jgi:four helix bundle protein
VGIVEEEIDESGYWLELLAEANIIRQSSVARLLAEVNELTAIVVASRKTALSSKTR